jgi:non-heme chloroperoxidase
MATSSGTVTTLDGVAIRYISAGDTNKPVLLLIPGWAQTAIQWRKQISYFSAKYRVIAIDNRGFGDSDKPERGYRVTRLAADLNDVILQLDLKDVSLCGHSMGCSIIWALWDTFVSSRSRISHIILVDQSSCMIIDPAWEEGVASSLGSIFTPSTAHEMGASLRGAEGSEYAAGFLRSLFSPSLSEEDFVWVKLQWSKMNPSNAATLLINHAAADWRDVIPTITVPTLVFGAETSVFGVQSAQWVASQISNSRLEIFKADESGSHFMFWENDAKFNGLVEEFLSS